MVKVKQIINPGLLILSNIINQLKRTLASYRKVPFIIPIPLRMLKNILIQILYNYQIQIILE